MLKDNNLAPEFICDDGVHRDTIEGMVYYRSNLPTLITKVGQWGVARNITAEGGATALSQTKKMFEEVQEFVDATTHKEGKDAVGDMFVVLIQICRLRGYKLDECLEMAWSEIKDRKGRMENGVFVKAAP